MKFLKILVLILMPLVCDAQAIINTLYGTGTVGYLGDGGPAATAQLYRPEKTRFDKQGNMYFLHRDYHTIRKVDAATGVISTLAGQGGVNGFSGDGSAAVQATLNRPMDIAIDDSGNVYIADAGNYRVRKINVITGIITTVAGNGNNYDSGDSGLAVNAGLYYPKAISVDHQFNLYISGENAVRKVDAATGVITRICGDGVNFYPVTGLGGLAVNATMRTPEALYCDSVDNLYILTAYSLYKITNTGYLYHIGGNDNVWTIEDEGPATWSSLDGNDLCMDRAGNIYISETRHRIRKIDTQSVIHTIVDTVSGFGSFFGDGGDPLSANIHTPRGVAVDSCGAVYIADKNNNRIRKVSYPGCGYDLGVGEMNTSFSFSLYPNPAHSEFVIEATEKIDAVSIVDVTGRTVFASPCRNDRAIVDVSGLSNGVYFVQVNNCVVKKFVKE